MAELKSFQEHWTAASLMGCTIATGSGKDEVLEIRQVAIDYQDNHGFLPVMWIGLAFDPIPVIEFPPNF